MTHLSIGRGGGRKYLSGPRFSYVTLPKNFIYNNIFQYGPQNTPFPIQISVFGIFGLKYHVQNCLFELFECWNSGDLDKVFYNLGIWLREDFPVIFPKILGLWSLNFRKYPKILTKIAKNSENWICWTFYPLFSDKTIYNIPIGHIENISAIFHSILWS